MKCLYSRSSYEGSGAYGLRESNVGSDADLNQLYDPRQVVWFYLASFSSQNSFKTQNCIYEN